MSYPEFIQMSDSKKSLRELWDNNRSRRPLEEYDFELQLMKQDFPKFRDPNGNNFQNDQHFQSYDRNGDFNSNFSNFYYGPHPYQIALNPNIALIHINMGL